MLSQNTLKLQQQDEYKMILVKKYKNKILELNNYIKQLKKIQYMYQQDVANYIYDLIQKMSELENTIILLNSNIQKLEVHNNQLYDKLNNTINENEELREICDTLQNKNNILQDTNNTLEGLVQSLVK